MKIYPDVSCLNRPFDDQSQARIRLEAEATTMIIERCVGGAWLHVSSQMASIEVEAIADLDRRAQVQLLLPDLEYVLQLTDDVFALARVLETLGFKPADAVHLAAAEAMKADVMLSCDDRLVKLARRRREQLEVRVTNPLAWLKEVADDADA